jgi:hypothetical protein
MEDLVIKMVPEHYKGDNDIKRLIKYVAGEGKNKDSQIIKYIGAKGLSKNPNTAAKQIITMQEALGKNDKRRVYQLIVSFPGHMKSEWLALRVGKRIADIIFEEHQVYYAIHDSTDNMHIHFVINAVSYTSGRKWHKNKAEFKSWKMRLQEA